MADAADFDTFDLEADADFESFLQEDALIEALQAAPAADEQAAAFRSQVPLGPYAAAQAAKANPSSWASTDVPLTQDEIEILAPLCANSLSSSDAAEVSIIEDCFPNSPASSSASKTASSLGTDHSGPKERRLDAIAHRLQEASDNDAGINNHVRVKGQTLPRRAGTGATKGPSKALLFWRGALFSIAFLVWLVFFGPMIWDWDSDARKGRLIPILSPARSIQLPSMSNANSSSNRTVILQHGKIDTSWSTVLASNFTSLDVQQLNSSDSIVSGRSRRSKGGKGRGSNSLG
jgi:hypothetical protein